MHLPPLQARLISGSSNNTDAISQNTFLSVEDRNLLDSTKKSSSGSYHGNPSFAVDWIQSGSVTSPMTCVEPLSNVVVEIGVMLFELCGAKFEPVES